MDRYSMVGKGLILAVLAAPCSGYSAVVSDATLGKGKVTVSGNGREFLVPADAGRLVKGRNLYHSLSEFRLGKREKATFAGPGGVENIIVRVTGGEASRINGTIRSEIVGADFFLMNASGVFFGPGAKLEVGGSFTVTTAQEIQLADGGRFPADAQRPARLTAAAPRAFGFLETGARLRLVGSELNVEKGKQIRLIGGDVRLVGTVLRAPEGSVQVLAGGRGSEVRENVSGRRGDIDILDVSRLEVDDDGTGGGGQVSIVGREIRLRDSEVLAQTRGAGAGQGVDINARGAVTLRTSKVSTSTAGGRGGDVNVRAASVRIVGDETDVFSGIEAESAGSGRGGDVNLNAGSVEFRRGGQISSLTASPVGGGVVRVEAGSVLIDSGGGIVSRTFGSGDAGSIFVTADRLRIDGIAGEVTGIRAGSAQSATGDGGRIEIDAGRLTLVDQGLISSVTDGAGAGGNIMISGGQIRIDGRGLLETTGIAANTQALSGGGRGGNIGISAGSLVVENAGSIDARSFGNGQAGSIRIVTSEDVFIDGTATPLATGITVQTGVATANSGVVRIEAGGNVLLSQGVITAEASGVGGRVFVASEVTALNESVINGVAGGQDVLVRIDGALLLSQGSRILTDRPAFTADDTVARSLRPLPQEFLDASAYLQPSCVARFTMDQSSLVIFGKEESLLDVGGWVPVLPMIAGPDQGQNVTQRERKP